MNKKTCRVCKQEKELSFFHKHKSRSLGVSGTCKKCAMKNSRQHYKNNRSHAQSTKLFKKYGITLADFNLLLAAQNGVCKLCKKEEKNPRKFGIQLLAVDHCHKTNKIRGLLCSLCNRGLGFFGDDPHILRAAASYLEKA